MNRFGSKLAFYIGSFFACFIMAFSSGCASGGYKTTRSLAQWLNGQNIILRVILYILGSFVFVITLLVDAVVFNTLDFWQGRVSSGTYEFKENDKMYHVKHEFQDGGLLKRSTITVKNSDQVLLQEVVLTEKKSGEIEMTVDGKVRALVNDINSVPVASLFDEKGQLIQNQIIWLSGPQKVAGQ
jgi:hypothetical protein